MELTPLFLKVESSCKTQHNTLNLHYRSEHVFEVPLHTYNTMKPADMDIMLHLTLSRSLPAFICSFLQLI